MVFVQKLFMSGNNNIFFSVFYPGMSTLYRTLFTVVESLGKNVVNGQHVQLIYAKFYDDLLS